MSTNASSGNRNMKLLLAISLMAVMPSTAFAQSDLRKIGDFLQQFQNQQQEPQNGGYGAGNPNYSGDQNQGEFGRQDFFRPQRGMQPVPQNQQQFQPNQIVYPNGFVPANPYPQGNAVPQYQPQSAKPIRVVYSNQPITIRCDADATGLCRYELVSASGTGFPYQITAGQSQHLKENTNWAFRYAPTLGAPLKTYRLRGGKTYELRSSGGAWQLYMLP